MKRRKGAVVAGPPDPGPNLARIRSAGFVGHELACLIEGDLLATWSASMRSRRIGRVHPDEPTSVTDTGYAKRRYRLHVFLLAVSLPIGCRLLTAVRRP
jgi:hypothetical protein